MKIYYSDDRCTLYQGNTLEVLKTLPDESVDCIVTSPPYWGLRDYGVEGQIGLESTLDEYLDRLLRITLELKRVLKKTGVMFWNHGDCYGGSGAGTWKNPPIEIKSKEVYHLPYGSNPRKRNNTDIKSKCMALQNYRLILKMIDEQEWILRDIIIWAKKVWIAKENTTIGNAMPSSVRDRCVFTFEPIFMMVKSKKYFFDQDVLRVPYIQPLNRWGGDKLKANGKSEWDKGTGQRTYRNRDMRPNVMGANRPNVWQINTEPFPEAHFATFPEKLVEPLIKCGCPQWICKKCGKPRVRITKPTEEYVKSLGKSWHSHKNDEIVGQRKEGGQEVRLTAQYITIGWTDCGCNAGWESGVVLDPFIGSGTTALVALKLNRRVIGIDIKEEYLKMAYKRIKPLLHQKKISDFLN